MPPLREQPLAETLLWLCAIESPTGEEAALCNALIARLARTLPGRPLTRVGNSFVLHATAGKAQAPRIALVGHLDTVRTENGPARIEGERLFGAGASDMKSGLAVMLALVEAGTAFPCDLSLVFYSREEGPYADNELGPLLDRVEDLSHLDLAICMEPTQNELQLGCAGTLHAQVTVHGCTAHSARPWQGESAVTRAIPLLQALAALPPREHLCDGLVYRTVTTVTQIQDGGRGRNVVPDRVVMNLNHRFAPDTSLEEAQREVEAIVAGHGELLFTDLSPSARPNRSHPLVASLANLCVRGVHPKQAWTDVARFAARGVPSVNFGPGEGQQAHQKNESVPLSLVYESYALLTRWLTSL